MKYFRVCLAVVMLTSLLSLVNIPAAYARSLYPCESNDFLLNPANQHQYCLTQKLNWSQAKLGAKLVGGLLVTIDDPEEEAWLRDNFGKGQNFWIGLYSPKKDNSFEWMSSGEKPDYTHWAKNQPQMNQDSYGVLGKNGWHDYPMGGVFDLWPLRGLVEVPSSADEQPEHESPQQEAEPTPISPEESAIDAPESKVPEIPLINIDATLHQPDSPLVQVLPAGTYGITVIGTEQGGQFDAWSGYGSVKKCSADGDGCKQGWHNEFIVSQPEGFYEKVDRTDMYKTPEFALQHSQGTTITLDDEGEVYFYVGSSSRYNHGGLSLKLEPTS